MCALYLRLIEFSICADGHLLCQPVSSRLLLPSGHCLQVAVSMSRFELFLIDVLFLTDVSMFRVDLFLIDVFSNLCCSTYLEGTVVSSAYLFCLSCGYSSETFSKETFSIV